MKLKSPIVFFVRICTKNHIPEWMWLNAVLFTFLLFAVQNREYSFYDKSVPFTGFSRDLSPT